MLLALLSCSSIMLNHQPLQMSFAPLNSPQWKEADCTRCTETLQAKLYLTMELKVT